MGAVVCLATLVLVYVSGFANWSFASGLGAGPWERAGLGAAALASDAIKIAFPLAFVWFLSQRMRWPAFVALVIGGGAATFSVFAAFGFASGERWAKYDAAEVAARVARSQQTRIERRQRQAGFIPRHRPLEIVRAEIAAAKAHKHYRWSRSCSRPRNTTQAHCTKYRQLTVELASAKAAAKMEAAIVRDEAALGKSTNKTGDYQVQFISNFTGMSKPAALMAAIAVMVFLIEAGSTFGLTIGLGMLLPESQIGKAIRQVLPNRRSGGGGDGNVTPIRPPEQKDGDVQTVQMRMAPPVSLRGGGSTKPKAGRVMRV